MWYKMLAKSNTWMIKNEISIAVWSKLGFTMTASVGQKDSGGNCTTVGQRQINSILRGSKRGGKARVWWFKYMTGKEGDDMMERRKADILDGREAKLGAVEVD